MLKEQLELLKKAYETYFSDTREDIDKKILVYVKDIVKENADILVKLIEMYKEEISLEEIYEVLDNAINSESIYKSKKVFKKREDGFVHGKYATSVGIIAIECSDTLKVLKYLANGIKSRNAIAISDIEFDETSLKAAFLVFFCEALEKFELDKNLIMLLPFEECYYEKFDRVIYGDSEKEKVKSRISKDVYYIYLEDKDFEDIAKVEIEKLKEQEKECYVLSGEFYKVINKINESFNKGAVIYTKSPELGYKFMNLIHSENVFVNTTLDAVEDIEKHENSLYMNKNIMYQLDRNVTNQTLDNSKETEVFENINKNTEIRVETIKAEQIEVNENKEKSLTLPEENIWYKKIIRKIKELFKKI